MSLLGAHRWRYEFGYRSGLAYGKRFRGRDGTSRAVLKDLDLTVGAGEFLCILGPSGCGKSTLLNVLAGLDKVYEGQVSVSGGRVGYLFQEPRLLPWLTADGNLDFALASCRVPTSRWSELKSRYLAMTGLSAYRDYYPHQISGGMAQRLALMRALVRGARHSPDGRAVLGAR